MTILWTTEVITVNQTEGHLKHEHVLLIYHNLLQIINEYQYVCFILKVYQKMDKLINFLFVKVCIHRKDNTCNIFIEKIFFF